MRRRGVVVGSRHPVADRRNKLESFSRRRGRWGELKRGLIERDNVQPDDVSSVISELRMVVIVRQSVVRLKVPVSRRAGMVGVGLVNVLGGQRRRKGDVGCQQQADHGTVEGRRHARGDYCPRRSRASNRPARFQCGRRCLVSSASLAAACSAANPTPTARIDRDAGGARLPRPGTSAPVVGTVPYDSLRRGS